MSQTLGHDGWPSVWNSNPFRYHPCQVYHIPKHMSKQKLYLSPKVQLLESSAQAFAIQFPRRDLLLFAWGFFGGVFFSWLFLCCLLSQRPLKSAMTFFQRWDMAQICFLRLTCDLESSWRLRVWILASQLIGVQSCCFVIIDFSFTKLHFMHPNLIFHRTTHSESWVPRWTTPYHLLTSSRPWKGTHSEETHSKQVMACSENRTPNLVVLKLNTDAETMLQ